MPDARTRPIRGCAVPGTTCARTHARTHHMISYASPAASSAGSRLACPSARIHALSSPLTQCFPRATVCARAHRSLPRLIMEQTAYCSRHVASGSLPLAGCRFARRCSAYRQRLRAAKTTAYRSGATGGAQPTRRPQRLPRSNLAQARRRLRGRLSGGGSADAAAGWQSGHRLSPMALLQHLPVASSSIICWRRSTSCDHAVSPTSLFFPLPRARNAKLTARPLPPLEVCCRLLESSECVRSAWIVSLSLSLWWRVQLRTVPVQLLQRVTARLPLRRHSRELRA